MWTLLYVNAYILLDKLGGRNHGNIALVMQDTLYATISPITYNAPVDPGVTGKVPAQETTSVCSQLQEKHVEDHPIHGNHNNMEAAIKNMVLKEVDSTYTFSLHNIFTGYMGL